MLLMVTPLPRPLTTPPVTTMYFIGSRASLPPFAAVAAAPPPLVACASAISRFGVESCSQAESGQMISSHFLLCLSLPLLLCTAVSAPSASHNKLLLCGLLLQPNENLKSGIGTPHALLSIFRDGPPPPFHNSKTTRERPVNTRNCPAKRSKKLGMGET